MSTEYQNTENKDNITKEEILSSDHPVGRKLREIPEIIFFDRKKMLPGDAIPLKAFFRREEMDAWHVDALVLKKIAANLLEILEKLGEIPVYPGLLGPEDILVNPMDSRYPVFITCPEKFQLLSLEQEYEWFPEDERLFFDVKLFDEKTQLLACNRLVYKILIASSRGNVKLPPVRVDTDYSHLFYQILPETWKEVWQAGEVFSLEEMAARLAEEISEEKRAEAKARQRMRAGAAGGQENAEPGYAESGYAESGYPESGYPLSKDDPGEDKKEDFLHGDRHILYVVIRTDLPSAREVSRMVCLLQEEEERECFLEKKRPVQGFVYGAGPVCVREFAAYEPGFRVQFPPEIRPCPAGELLTIAADLLEELTAEDSVSLPKEDNASLPTEIQVYLILDGRLANDALFRFGTKRLAREKEKGQEKGQPKLALHLRYSGEIYCEAAAELERLCDSAERM